MRKFIVDVCERILARLDPIRLQKCKISNREISISIGGYLVPEFLNEVSYTIGCTLTPSKDGKSCWYRNTSLVVNGSKKEEKLVKSEFSNIKNKRLILGLDTK